MAVSESFHELIGGCEWSAVHLEVRDAYTPSDPVFQRWLAGDLDASVSAIPEWSAAVADNSARGVAFRRARVVSEPVTDYIAFEHAITEATNIAAGESVRWLPRRMALDLPLTTADFWLFDERVVRFAIFSGVGEIVEMVTTRDAGIVKLCVEVFGAVWDRATDHEAYVLAR